jgi:UDP-glucose-4-epimerase GalE
VCKHLARSGYLPVAYDNLSTGHAYAVKWGPFVQGDLQDEKKLDEAFQLYEPVAVLHFAASSLVIESMQNPGLYYKNNTLGTLSLLEAMRRHRVESIVFSSTCATYGHPLSTPITEEHTQRPVSPYGKSKWMGEQILADYDRAYSIRYAALRYFNAAGADSELEIGEHHDPETHLIPSAIQAGLSIRPEIVVYGADFPTTDGSAIRDYIHVEDLALAHRLSLERLLSESPSFHLNLGTGRGTSVFEILEGVERALCSSVPHRIEMKREGEPAILSASFAKANELLGWEPTRSLETILSSAVSWHKLLLDQQPLLDQALGRNR